MSSGWLSGCRSEPHRDLYVDQMASEIRVLEDQLYEADYENKVLRNKLERAVDAQSDFGTSDALPRRSTDRDPTSRRSDQDSSDQHSHDAEAPRSGATLLPPSGGLPSGGDPSELEDRHIDTPDAAPKASEEQDALVPPDLEGLELPDIDMGEIIPPPGPDAPPEMPQGQIPLPNLNPPELPEPVGLSINPTFSGGHNFDSDPAIDGVYLVIHFVDQQGQVLDLSNVDIDADLSIELQEPEPLDGQPPIGRWDFSAEEIAAMRRDSVQHGIHVALRWSETQPAGDRVVAVVKVTNGDTLLEGQSELTLVGKGQIAGWAPRAGAPASNRK